jgi:urease accessory protein
MRKVPPDITIMADTITIMTERPDRFEPADPPGEGEETTTSLHVPAGGETLPPVALLVWLSPSFPVGSFAFSHGLEWAVEAGDIKDLASLTSWIGSLIRSGGCYNDAVLLAVAWRAMQNADMASLKDANELAIGLAGSRERRLETVAQGNAFMKAVMTAWSAPAIDKAFAHVEGDFAYPVAVATASAAHDMPLATTLQAFCLAVVQNLVSASIRLNAVGQTDGQRAIAALLPLTQALASDAQGATIDDVGGAAFRSDIAALKHETQYTRLFRS